MKRNARARCGNVSSSEADCRALITRVLRDVQSRERKITPSARARATINALVFTPDARNARTRMSECVNRKRERLKKIFTRGHVQVFAQRVIVACWGFEVYEGVEV